MEISTNKASNTEIPGVTAKLSVLNLQDEARIAAEEGVVGGVRAGISTSFAQNRAWPAQLDNAAAGSTASNVNPFFDDVLEQGGVTSDWTKAAGNPLTYIGPTTTTYTYNSGTGAFTQN